MPKKTNGRKAARGGKQPMDDDTLNQTENNDTEEQPTEQQPETSQLDRIEFKLDQLLAYHSNQNLLQPHQAKVPYVAPELPAGLSPNQIINHPLVKGQSGNPTEPVNPMVSETEPAEVG